MKIYIFTLTFFLITIFSYSQRVKIKFGNLKNLKGVNQYNLIFDYSDLQILNYESETDFLNEKVALREKQKKGSGIRYKKDWFENRKRLYEPFFEKYFNAFFIKKRKIIVSQNNTNAKYTILVKSKILDSGYYESAAWVISQLWVEIIVFEKNNPENIIFVTKKIKIRYGNYDYNAYNTGNRIAKVYGVLAERLANYFRKKT